MWPTDNVAQDGMKTSFQPNFGAATLHCKGSKHCTLNNMYDTVTIILYSWIHHQLNRKRIDVESFHGIRNAATEMYYWMVAHLGNWFIWVNCLVCCVLCVCAFFLLLSEAFPSCFVCFVHFASCICFSPACAIAKEQGNEWTINI